MSSTPKAGRNGESPTTKADCSAGFGTAHRESGYLLRRASWGQGLPTELAHALVAWHHHYPDPVLGTALHGDVYGANTASGRRYR